MLGSFKVLIIGDTNVGKTSLLLRYADNTFEASRTTIGFDLKTKVEKLNHHETATLHVYDTAGTVALPSCSYKFQDKKSTVS
jgi:small GTP-binding protein